MPHQKPDYTRLLSIAMKYCAYSERCIRDVRSRLERYDVPEKTMEKVITGLESQGFLDEERFARSYSGGKFRMKQWGRLRIAAGLKARGLPERIIGFGLAEIEEREYCAALKNLLKNRLADFPKKTAGFLRKRDAARYAIGKGFEPELVWELLGH